MKQRKSAHDDEVDMLVTSEGGLGSGITDVLQSREE
jgi:hypothetical protein